MVIISIKEHTGCHFDLSLAQQKYAYSRTEARRLRGLTPPRISRSFRASFTPR